ncbi:recombinase family protein [Paenibacillus albidus]|nr:recombinase family protein [Paenibacillus albidus]MBT2289465.1 recombinase family protein [Paenibacillus albidus]
MKLSYSAVSIKTIINNPVYIGKIRYNVRENWSEQRRQHLSHIEFMIRSRMELRLCGDTTFAATSVLKVAAFVLPIV